MTKRRKVVPSRRFSTDRLSSRLWLSLREDFCALLDAPENYFRVDAKNLRDNIVAFREGIDRKMGYVSPIRLKCSVQLQALLKKYRFRTDVYSDEELDKLTTERYMADQVRLGETRDMKALGVLVCQRARKIASEILGEYSPIDAVEKAKFGKKSSIGCPLNSAYIDFKLSNVAAFTGSSECGKWFEKSVLPNDAILNRMVERLPFTRRAANMHHTALKLVNVPKTWKIRRSITPLTLISLFYSYGVGWQVTERLKEYGLDIRHLQDKHRRLVKKFSKSCSHATADLSAASDSITSELLNRVLPRKWYNAVKMASTHHVDIDGIDVYTESVLPMGNGLTFPVETLVFYCITKAIGELSKCDGLYSVYGDDLIYPSKLHKYVRVVFPMLRLKLNMDKTFVHFPFRESCGEDYYRGFPVRPFQLQGESADLSAVRYQSYLYKTYNGLLRRWSEHEIPRTLRFIILELMRVTDEILRVPPLYPDTSGIKVENLHTRPLDDDPFIPWAPIKASFENGSRWFTFRSLYTTMKRRVVLIEEPYYWLALQGRDDDPDPRSFKRESFSMYHMAPRSPLSWRTLKRVRVATSKTGKKTRKVVRKRVLCCSSRVEESTTSITGTVSDWI